MASFPLATEPWIPCLGRDGRFVLVGLRDLFERAHELECVHDASPLSTLALHRFLLAVLHRVTGPFGLTEWRALFRRGRFDPKPVAAYLDEHAERLDLLHDERPFLQVRGLTKLYEPDGLDRLILERSNYGAPRALFQHRPEAVARGEGLTFAEGARALLALHAFAPGGLVKKPGEPTAASAAPMNRGAFVLVLGHDVFETLLLNLLEYDPEKDQPFPGNAKKDVPSWEQKPLARATGAREPQRTAHGWIDLLTWQGRRLELTLTADGTRVGGVVYCVGQGLDDEGRVDPMLAVRVDEKRGPVEIGFSEERAVWRDCHALVRTTSADGARAPDAVRRLARDELRDLLGERRRAMLAVLGMRGDQAKIRMAREERLAVPIEVLRDDDRLARVEAATKAAERTSGALRSALRWAVAQALAPSGRSPDRDEVSRVAASLGGERVYWATVGSAFDAFLDAVARGEADAVPAFARQARRAALDAFEESTEGLGTSARQLQAAARAEQSLRRDVRQIFSDMGVEA
jgi:CRISPR system Cascade subunit CasA